MITVSQSSARISFFLVVCAFIASHIHFLLLPDIFNTWEKRTADQLFVFRNNSKWFAPAYDNRVAHVDLTNTSIDALNRFYFNRFHFAQMVSNLSAMQASAQMWDFIFAGKKNADSDEALINATAAAGHVYFGAAFSLGLPGNDPEAINALPPFMAEMLWHPELMNAADHFYVGETPLPTFAELSLASRGTGSLSFKFDADGVLRRVPLLIRYGEGFVPSLPLRLACDYLGVDPARIIVLPGEAIVLTGAKIPRSAHKNDIRIPIDRQGNMVVNFIGPWERMDHYNFADILDASNDSDLLEMWGEELQGKILILSDVTTGSTDTASIPGDSDYPLCGVHANIIHNILTGSFVTEMSHVGIAAMEITVLLLIWLMSLRFTSLAFSLGSLVAGAGTTGVAVAGFLYGNLLIPIVQPLQMVFFAVLSILIYRYVKEEREKLEGLRQRDEIRSTFGRYLSNEVVEELMASPEGRHLGGEIRTVTFLVSDLRGFTTMSSTMAPEKIIETLNRFLEPMVSIIARYQGTVDEIQGDGLLVFFGAPLCHGDEERRAAACAVEMQNALIEFNQKQRQHELPALEMGIGIHTGEVVVGNIGSETRAKYGAVGSAINMAFRIESQTVGGQVLISEATRTALGDEVMIRNQFEVSLKGLDAPLRLFDITGFRDPPGPKMKHMPEDTVALLAKPYPVKCFVIDGKKVNTESIHGQVMGEGSTAVDLYLDDPVASFSNLKIVARKNVAGVAAVVYGKAVGEGSAPDTIRVIITGSVQEQRTAS